MEEYKNNWSSNPDIINRMFILTSNSFQRNKKFFINLLCVSQSYNLIGSRHKPLKGGCKCDCTKMKQYKIADAIKGWMCEGCEDRIHDNSWKKREYYFGKKQIHKHICKECYANHWIRVLYRPLFLCLIDASDSQ